MIYREPGCHTPPPPSRPVTHMKTEKRDNSLTEDGGEEPNNRTVRKPGHKSFNTLCLCLYTAHCVQLRVEFYSVQCTVVHPSPYLKFALIPLQTLCPIWPDELLLLSSPVSLVSANHRLDGSRPSFVMIPALRRVLKVNFTIPGTLKEFEIQTLPGHFARF